MVTLICELWLLMWRFIMNIGLSKAYDRFLLRQRQSRFCFWVPSFSMRVSSLQWGKLYLGSSIFSCTWQHEKCGIQVISQMMNDSYWWWFYGGLPFFVICLVYLRVMIPFIRNSLDRFNHQVSQSFWQRTTAVNSQPTSMEKGSVVRELCSKKGLSFRLFFVNFIISYNSLD